MRKAASRCCCFFSTSALGRNTVESRRGRNTDEHLSVCESQRLLSLACELGAQVVVRIQAQKTHGVREGFHSCRQRAAQTEKQLARLLEALDVAERDGAERAAHGDHRDARVHRQGGQLRSHRHVETG